MLKAFLGRWLARFFFPRGWSTHQLLDLPTPQAVGTWDLVITPTVPGAYRHVGILHHIQNMGFHGVLLTIQAVIPPFSLYPMAGIDLQETRSCVSSW